MPYDEELAVRVRTTVQREDGLTEKRMFGGLAFLINGHLAVSASSKGGLLVRVKPEETESLLDQARVGLFERRGREMDGWLHVSAEALRDDDDLQVWVTRGIDYARSLPPKQGAS